MHSPEGAVSPSPVFTPWLLYVTWVCILPVEAFELLAWGNPVGIVLNNNPINAYCLCNCVIDEDRLENKKPIKVSQFRKIDGAITMLMTLGLMSAYER